MPVAPSVSDEAILAVLRKEMPTTCIGLLAALRIANLGESLRYRYWRVLSMLERGVLVVDRTSDRSGMVMPVKSFCETLGHRAAGETMKGACADCGVDFSDIQPAIGEGQSAEPWRGCLVSPTQIRVAGWGFCAEVSFLRYPESDGLEWQAWTVGGAKGRFATARDALVFSDTALVAEGYTLEGQSFARRLGK